MIKLIAAISLNSVIGKNNSLPWGNNYPEDLSFFRKMTSGSTIIMGRKTFESIGRPLPKRRNIILTKKIIPKIEGADIFSSLNDAIKSCGNNDTWIIGGSSIYQESLKFAEELYLTTIPEIIEGDDLVYFPYVNPSFFTIQEKIEINKDKNLYCFKYVRN